MTDPLQSLYDEFPYPSIPFVDTHPYKLAAVATLYGLDPPPVRNCRLLEIGCAQGDNILPLAYTSPAGEFVGVDISARQITDAQKRARQLGLKNVDLRAMDVRDLLADLGSFDYIIAHGIYSWVPKEARDAILAVCQRHLKPGGLGYISYNTYPGWRTRSVVRDLLLYHASGIEDPRARIEAAKEILKFMCEGIPEPLSGYRDLFTLSRSYKEFFDNLLMHDYMAEPNDPVYFADFATHLEAFELKFVAESNPVNMAGFPRHVLESLMALGADQTRREQYLDFLTNRAFRQSIICPAATPVESFAQTERMMQLEISSNLACDENEDSPVKLRQNQKLTFRDLAGTEVEVSHPLTKAALVVLQQFYPRAIPFDELHRRARAYLIPDQLVIQSGDDYQQDNAILARDLLAFYAADGVEIQIDPPAFAAELSPHPRANPITTWQIDRGSSLTNLLHNSVKLGGPQTRLLRMLDGTRTPEEACLLLAEQLWDEGQIGVDGGAAATSQEELAAMLLHSLPKTLEGFRSMALLEA